jgi:hypothetical protein
MMEMRLHIKLRYTPSVCSLSNYAREPGLASGQIREIDSPGMLVASMVKQSWRTRRRSRL